MSVKEFELFHGAVLTKLARSKKALTLCMIETKPGDDWSSYRVNDAVSLLLKHSLVSRSLSREKARVWQFVFSPDQIRQLQQPGTWAALVCGSKTASDTSMEVCLLDPPQVEQLLDLTAATQQALMVKRIEGKSLRAYSGRSEEFVVPRNRLDTWVVPGA
jgi:hypothetical protein